MPVFGAVTVRMNIKVVIPPKGSPFIAFIATENCNGSTSVVAAHVICKRIVDFWSPEVKDDCSPILK